MNNINIIVGELINKYCTNDPFEIANELGINTIICPLGNIKGHYLTTESVKVFFISSDLSQIDKTIVCAAILGHTILYSDLTIFYFNLDFNEQIRQFIIELLDNIIL
nr:ImmA/IrrE family metallo-endopeptidase [Clostridium paraputrificum]